MASDYTTVSGMSKDDALAAMDKETWYTNEETVDAGFASKVLGDSEAKASATCSGKFVMAENAIVTALTTPRKKTYALPERVAAVVATLERMAHAAGIEVSTINQTLGGTIDCPPRTRREGFAEEMDISADFLISAAEEDGCTNYSDNDDDDMEARMGARTSRTQRVIPPARRTNSSARSPRNETRHAPHWSRSSRPTLT